MGDRQAANLPSQELRAQPEPSVSVFKLGTIDYEDACKLQQQVAAARARGGIGDALLVMQHPPVITVGRGGGGKDILAPASLLRQMGVRVVSTDRGGRATYHGPGQLVAYPILRIPDDDLHGYVRRLEEVVIRVLSGYGLAAGRVAEHPGVWISGNKIAAVGIAMRDGVTRHGLALNVAPQMAHFDLLVPCGIVDRGVTSMERELGQAPSTGRRGEPVEPSGQAPDVAKVADRFVKEFGQVFGYRLEEGDPSALASLNDSPEQPAWLWQRLSPGAESAVAGVERLLAGLCLHTVCQEARCPNVAECFCRGTATFMILGDTCTRGCRFCAVRHGRPAPLDPDEPERVAEAAARMGLRHVVVTSVTRDDLPDGGAGQFAATVRALRRRLPEATVEVLIPDLAGCCAALEAVLDAQPDVLNHNLETVVRLYPRVRPGADYHRSLGVLAWAKVRAPHIVTKSGLMLGLGERTVEVLDVFHDLRRIDCDLLTLGQYLQPTDCQLPVVRYVHPDEFDGFKERADALGFRGVAAGPLVRSSYRAETLL
jgi:lipoic acid synthetase